MPKNSSALIIDLQTLDIYLLTRC